MADFSQALARAKELAAKYSTTSLPASGPSTNGSSTGIKRPADNYDDSPPSSQKRMNPVNDKIAQAAEIAARLNQKIGGPTNPNAVMGNIVNNPLGGDGKQTIAHKVPDGYVGLIIGKKGEQITRIQRETGCTVQIAPDSGGLPDRSVTLTGTPEQISAVKNIFQDIINNARPNPTASVGLQPALSSQGQHTIEVSIPGQRAGLIIGKSGETIKQLQEQTGTKMVLIQDTSAPTDQDKPLRITGDPASVEKAKQMVVDLLNARGAVPGSNPYGNRATSEFPVPAEKAGLVIGRGGETIKDISRQSGARLEIQKQPPPNPNFKIFTISGEQSQIEHAIRLICERTNLPPPGQASAHLAAPQYSGTPYYGADQYGQQQNAWAQQSAGQWTPAAPVQAQPVAATPAAPSVNPQTGQPDYTAAWVEYYRRQGMHEQANAILRMSQSGGQPQAQAQPTQPQQQPQQQNPAPSQNNAGGYDYSQWQQYQQWQQPQQQYPSTNAGWGQAQHPPGTGGSQPTRSG